MKNSGSSKPKSKPPVERPAFLAKLAGNAGNADLDTEIDDFLQTHDVEQWDVLIFGDGSGAGWEKRCGAGWGSVTIEKPKIPGGTGERRVMSGHMSVGTVNVAEMMAVLQPLNYLASREEDRRDRGGGTRAYQVHIFTDSEYCKNTGNSDARVLRRNEGLWAVFDVFARRGFVLNWHWIARETFGLNWYADTVSKLARRDGQHYNLQEDIESYAQRSVYDVNPGGGRE